MDHGQEIRKLADEFRELTGEHIFTGVEHRGTVNVYMFTEETFNSGEEALGYMKYRLEGARADAIVKRTTAVAESYGVDTSVDEVVE